MGRGPGWRPLAAGALTTALLTGCVIDTVAIPRSETLIQVHGILNTGRANQPIIVERVLGSGDANVRGGAVAISGARVTVTAPNGFVWTLVEKADTIEDPTVGTVGAVNPLTRRYEFSPDASHPLVPGGSYQLRVVTPEGEVVTGSTQIPYEIPVLKAASRTFNRDRDTLSLTWPQSIGAAAFWVRADGQGTSFDEFLGGTHVKLGGDLKSLEFDEDRRDVFTPGFESPITVGAVEQNAYDYFRTVNDPFTGLGRVNRLKGGYGVFGAVVPVVSVLADVTADVVDSMIEGHWVLQGTPPATGPRVTDLRLYADRGFVSSDTASTVLYGSYLKTGSTTRRIANARRDGDNVTVELIRNDALDDRLTGTVTGNTLRLTYQSDFTNAVFIRRP